MIRLEQSLGQWQESGFEQALKSELKALPPGCLPLQQGVLRGGYADPSELEVSLLQQAGSATCLSLRVALFFHETIAGCSCGDDPVSEPVYCELDIRIDRQTAEASFKLR
ncbi:MAG: glucosamine--fructose-6-phosphate aminotransferase [Sedimenticola sp.]|nr:glucosamine--fructose-6-phosphate aminotransferase [Sedimenticola sp.]